MRAERTRQAIVDALLSLLDEGDIKPTAERVATRAGVSERSVFQHFSDREALFGEAAKRQFERVAPQLDLIPSDLPLPERVEAFVDQRMQFFELVSGVRRAALLLEHESEIVADWLRAVRQANRVEVDRLFGEQIEAHPPSERAVVRAALIAASSWTAWESYRFHQGLEVDNARAALRHSIATLLGTG